MIATFYPPYSFGGDGTYVHQLSNGLAHRGYSVDVIHCVDSFRILAGKEPDGSYMDHPNITVHPLKSKLGPLSPLLTQQTGYPFLKKKKIFEILDQGFDVIHYHNISLAGGPGVLKFGNAVKLYTMHDHWLVCPMHILYRNNRRICRNRSCLTCSLMHLRPPQLWRYTNLLRKSVRHVDCFISSSRFTMEKHRELGFLEESIELIPPFVPLSADESQRQEHGETKAGLESDNPYFLFAGRLEQLKGPQSLIPVFAEYKQADLIIAGRGGFERKLKQLASGIENIEFAGFKSGRELADLYRGARAVIIPSECYETFPLVAVESMRFGIPVIARNRGGLPEAVENTGGGLIYDTGEELMTAVDRLTNDDDLHALLSRNAREQSQLLWNEDAHLEHYIGLVRNLRGKQRSYP